MLQFSDFLTLRMQRFDGRVSGGQRTCGATGTGQKVHALHNGLKVEEGSSTSSNSSPPHLLFVLRFSHDVSPL